MRTITSIVGKEKLKSKDGKAYIRTHAVLDDGSEVVGFGDDFKVGDKVMCFFDQKWNQIKMSKAVDKPLDFTGLVE